jgi:hypothetical protein
MRVIVAKREASLMRVLQPYERSGVSSVVFSLRPHATTKDLETINSNHSRYIAQMASKVWDTDDLWVASNCVHDIIVQSTKFAPSLASRSLAQQQLIHLEKGLTTDCEAPSSTRIDRSMGITNSDLPIR